MNSFHLSNLLPKRTGLPYTVWYGTKDAFDVPKVMVDLGNNEQLFINIGSKEVSGDVSKIDERDLSKVLSWLELNKGILLQYWNEASDGNIDDIDVYSELKSII
jgi:hypothetical protein